MVLLAVLSTGSRKYSISVLPSPKNKTKCNNSYVLAIRYYEQLTSGIRNSLQLGHLFKEMDARLVEPFVQNSGLSGISRNFCPRQKNCTSKAKPISTILDYSKISKECYDLTEPVSFQTFLETSARQLVLLHPMREMDHGSGLKTILSEKHMTELKNCVQNDHHVCECGNILKRFVTAVETSLNKNYKSTEVAPFSIRSVICFDTAQPLTLASLLQSVPHGSPLSYVFTFWYGTACKKQMPGFKPGSERGVGLKNVDMYENTILKICTEAKRTHIVPQTSLPEKCARRSDISASLVSIEFMSQPVKELATAFLGNQHLKNIKSMVAIHYRTEWIYKTLGDSSKAVKCCMKEINQLFASLSADHEINLQENSILISDQGPYGSRSCASSCSRLADSLLIALKKSHNLTAVYFDPVKYNCTSYGSSIPALVEHASLARGRYLVLIGGGKFQRSILTSALQVGNVKRVYSVCSQYTKAPEGIPSGVEHYSLNSCFREV